jgi:hypothetical protein
VPPFRATLFTLCVEKGEAITNATMFNQHTLRLGRRGWAPLMAAVLLGVFGAATAQTSEFACLHRLSVRLPAHLRAGAWAKKLGSAATQQSVTTGFESFNSQFKHACRSTDQAPPFSSPARAPIPSHLQAR